MIDGKAGRNIDGERIDVQHDYAVCAWARHFNTSESRDQAGKVREHLAGGGGSDRPSAR
jgi:hypothetical protein